LLDGATGSTPTYLINADVHSTWLNTAALQLEGFASPDGMLREEDAFEISRRLNAVDPTRGDAAVIAAGQRAASRGVTGLVDFDMAWNADAW
ncbi:metal-dependent hydrolase, partial [Pseudomonas sp. BGM005]|nr:metal-dependent hydrolase [Pseudomonas sp. BG5]